MAQKPVIGMIVPPAGDVVPPECPALYGDRADFIAAGLGLESLTPEGYDQVIGKVADTARRLADQGADAVVLMGTSLSFYRGADFNDELVQTIAEASGRPATTMSNAIVDALRALDTRRVVVGTAYVDAVNRRLEDFLAASGFAVTGLTALDMADVGAVLGVTQAQLLDLGRRAWDLDRGADAILISCGGLHTLDVTAALETETGLPVVSSAVAGGWAAMRLAGVDAAAPGYGRLLAAA
jgi:arylmalonate decarboxylase